MRKLNSGTVLGFIALFVALSGGAYAAISLPKNSVTTKQVKDHSLLKRDFKGGQIPRGPAGPQGVAGPQGAQGPSGPVNLGALTRVDGPSTPVCAFGSACAVASSTAVCPTGMRVISGGMFEFTGGTSGHFEQVSSDRTSYQAGVANGSDYANGEVRSFALCAPTGAAVAARARHMTASTKREAARMEFRLRAGLYGRSYANCTALNKAYPHGVGRSGARDHTSGTPVTNFKVSNTLYAYNDGSAPRHVGERDLDRDNDGIACEKL